MSENNEIISIEFDEKKMELIKNTVCKDATQAEYEVFIEICKTTKLNPLFKQIYFIKRGGVATHQTSIDGLRLIADRTKRYIPGREPSFVYDKSGTLFSATSYVKKLAHDGSWHEVAATAMFHEYNAKVNVWNKMPHIMLAKCAEALALRRAFPADMLGIYTREEMEQADVQIPEQIRAELIQPTVETLGIKEILEIEAMIGEDVDLLDRILKSYGKTKLSEIERVHYLAITRGLEKKYGKTSENT
jgi:phage recombination protein Bet